MTIQDFQPRQPIYLAELFNELFYSDDPWDRIKSKEVANTFPNYPHNIYITDEYDAVFEFAVIGCDKEAISVNVEGNTLMIDIVINDKNETDKYFLCNKLVNRSAKLNYTLHENLDVEKIKVTLKNGLLKVVVPRKEETKPKSINFDIE